MEFRQNLETVPPLPKPIIFDRLSIKVNNDAPADAHMGADQLLRKIKKEMDPEIEHTPKQQIFHGIDLESLKKRKTSEDSLSTKKTAIANWVEYGEWEKKMPFKNVADVVEDPEDENQFPCNGIGHFLSQMLGEDQEDSDDDSVSSRTVKSFTCCKREKFCVKVHYTLDQVQDKRICKYCNQKFSIKTSSTHLKKHMQTKHSSDLKPKVISFNTSISKNMTDEQNKVLNHLVMKLIIGTPQAPEVVDNASFIELLQYLNSGVKLISCMEMKQNISIEFDTRKSEMKSRLCDVSHIGLTAEIWSCNNDEFSFLSLTAHGLDKKWNPVNYVIDFIPSYYPHFSEYVCEDIYESLVEYDIVDKVVSITTDPAANLIAGADLLQSKLKNNIGKFCCLIKILNVCVMETLEVFYEDFVAIAQVASKIYRCPEIKDVYKKRGGTRIPLRWDNTWESCYLQIAGYVQNFYVILHFKKEFELNPNLQTSHNIVYLEKIANFFKFFYDASKSLQVKNCTMGMAQMLLHKVIKYCTNQIADNSATSQDNIKQAATAFLAKMDTYTPYISNYDCYLACIFDPRIKYPKYDCLPAIYKNNASYHEQLNQLIELEKIPISEPTLTKKEDLTFLGKLFFDAEQEIKQRNIDQIFSKEAIHTEAPDLTSSDELQDYLSIDRLNHTQNPYMWWNDHKSSYPRLSAIAARILVSQSVVDLERSFSECRSIYTPEQITISQISLLHNWYKKFDL